MGPPVNRPDDLSSLGNRGPQSEKGYPSLGGVWTSPSRKRFSTASRSSDPDGMTMGRRTTKAVARA